jgi:hypothetical protein
MIMPNKRKHNEIAIDDQVDEASVAMVLDIPEPGPTETISCQAQIKPWGCSHCNATFSNSQDFAEHHISVHPGLSQHFRCSKCEIIVNCEDSFNQHILQCQREGS